MAEPLRMPPSSPSPPDRRSVMRSAVWSARHWNDEGAAETCREPPVPRVPVSERKNPLHRESLDHRLRIQHKGSQRIAKSTEGWDRPACANLAPREQNPMHPETQAAQPRLRDLLETQPPSQQKPKPSKPAPTHPGTSARPKHFSRRKNLMRPETQAEQPRLRALLETQPASQSKSKNPATRHRPLPPACGQSAFRDGKTSCALRPRPSSPVSATSWKLSLPPSQNQNPATRHRPLPPACGRSAFLGGRTSCALRLSGRSPSSATSRKLSLPPSQNQRSADKHRPTRHARAAEARIPVEEPYAPRETAYPKPEARTRPHPDTIALPTRGAGLETGGRMVR